MDTGGLKGRSAMLTMTTGCYSEMVEPDGLLGGLDVNLWHLNSGTLAYAGFKVLPPFMAFSIRYTTAEDRAKYLDEYAARLSALGDIEPMFFHPLADFGSDWRLKPGVQPRTIGQRRLDEKKIVES
jgi:NAD(P)H dehydrogenase (quinone)